VLAIICRSYGAYRDLDAGSYKDFAPTEHDLGLPNVQTPGAGVPARARAGSKLAVDIEIQNSAARSKYSLAQGGLLLTHSRAVVAARTFRSVLVSNSRWKTAKKLTRIPAARIKKEGCAEASINGHAR